MSKTDRIIILPSNSFSSFSLYELWDYRDLLFFLAWRDISLRYKQTLLGIFWAIIQPVFLMIIFTIVFGQISNVRTDSVPYALFAFSGLLPWTFFANSVMYSGNSLVGNSYLITKVYFPRLIIPCSAVIALLLDLIVATCILFCLCIWFGISPTWRIIFLPFVIIHLFLFSLSVGLWLSALNVQFRDIRHALPFVIQVWMFSTPVIYPIGIIGNSYRWLFAFNPMTGILDVMRYIFFDTSVDLFYLFFSIGITIIMLYIAVSVFRSMERSFADVV